MENSNVAEDKVTEGAGSLFPRPAAWHGGQFQAGEYTGWGGWLSKRSVERSPPLHSDGRGARKAAMRSLETDENQPVQLPQNIPG